MTYRKGDDNMSNVLHLNTDEFLETLKNGDKDARAKLIEHNLRLVAHIVKKYYASTFFYYINRGIIGCEASVKNQVLTEKNCLYLDKYFKRIFLTNDQTIFNFQILLSEDKDACNQKEPEIQVMYLHRKYLSYSRIFCMKYERCRVFDRRENHLRRRDSRNGYGFLRQDRRERKGSCFSRNKRRTENYDGPLAPYRAENKRYSGRSS